MTILRFRAPFFVTMFCAGALIAGHNHSLTVVAQKVVDQNSSQGRARKQAVEYAETRQMPAETEAELRKSQEALKSGKVDRAIKHLRTVVSIDPGNADAYNELGVLYYSNNEPEEAIEAFAAMVAIDPDSYRAHVNLAFALNARQRYQEAERVARRGVELRKMDLKLRYLLGMALSSQRKNPDEAADNLAMAAEEYPEARLELSRMLVEKGDFERAMRELQRFTEDRRFGEKHGVTPVQLFAK